MYLLAEDTCFCWTKERKEKEIKSVCTKIGKISLKALIELILVEHDNAKVTSVAMAIEIIGDFGSLIKVPDDTLVGVAPGGGEELEEVAQLDNVLLHPLQVLLLPLHVLVIVCCLCHVLGFQLHFDFHKLLHEESGITELSGNEGTGLIDDLLELTTAAVTHELLRSTRVSAVLVVLAGV